MYKTV